MFPIIFFCEYRKKVKEKHSISQIYDYHFSPKWLRIWMPIVCQWFPKHRLPAAAPDVIGPAAEPGSRHRSGRFSNPTS